MTSRPAPYFLPAHAGLMGIPPAALLPGLFRSPGCRVPAVPLLGPQVLANGGNSNPLVPRARREAREATVLCGHRPRGLQGGELKQGSQVRASEVLDHL